MINFYLPNLIGYDNLNIAIITLLNKSPELFYDDIKIHSVYGSFPNVIWNGGRLQIGKMYSYNEMKKTIDTINELGVAIRYTYTNCKIEEKHLNDTLANLTMDLANNGKNEVLTNSEYLENYLRKTYPNFKYISSTTKCITSKSLLEQELEKNYELVVLDSRLNNNFELLKQINKKDKLEILLNTRCQRVCYSKTLHFEKISEKQLLFDDSFLDIDCPNKKSINFYDNLSENEIVISVEDLYGTYVPMGFKHFKIEGRQYNFIDVLESYVYYLVKPEYRDFVRFALLKNINSFKINI